MSYITKAQPLSVPFGQSCIVLDVRTGVEHRAVALKQAHFHVPLAELDVRKFLTDNKIDAARPVYILCRSGKRAEMAAEAFLQAGHSNVQVVEGGIVAAEAAGIPVSKGGAMPLERQVRIAAGLLVVAGSTLGFALSPWFYALAGLVGAGLVFAGVTDRCGMALALAKAPWNREAGSGDQPQAACAGANQSCAAPPLENAPRVHMPDGISFYSPAEGPSAPVHVHALAKTTGKSTGGCS